MNAAPQKPSLESLSFLCRLAVQQWTARKIDKGLTTVTTSRAGAREGALSVSKKLIECPELDRIRSTINAARETHDRFTLPWSDDGTRILPLATHGPYLQAMDSHKTEFDAALADFIAVYDARVMDAEIALGAAYDPAAYPDPEEIRQKFSMSVEFLPFPSSADFRLEASEELTDYLKNNLQATLQSRHEQALQACFDRIREALAPAIAWGEDKKTRVDPRAYGKIESAVEILEKLNIYNNKELSEALESMRLWLDDYNMDNLTDKDLRHVRKNAARDAAAIVDGLSW